MRDRICFMCKEPLNYNDYIATNISTPDFIVYSKFVEDRKLCKIVFRKEFRKHELVKIWSSNYTLIACCNCNRFLSVLISLGPVLWKMLENANDPRLDVLKELGVQNYEDLKKLKNRK